MAWSLWQPAKVQNVQASLVEGGTLLANTTYYVRVVSFDSLSATRYTGGWNNLVVNTFGPYSDVVQITTTSTHRSIALTWDKVYKQDGVTEVDAYDVLCTSSLSDYDYDNKRVACSTSYLNPATSINSYTIIAPAQQFWHRIPDGVPNISWDGAGKATMASLSQWMHSNGHERFIKVLTSFGSDVEPELGYMLLARLKINPSASGYAFEMKQTLLWVFGGFDVLNCKVNLRGCVIIFLTPSHNGGSNLGWNAAGSSIVSCDFRSMTGNGAIPVSAGRQFFSSPQIMKRAPYESFYMNTNSTGSNYAYDLLVKAPLLRLSAEGSAASGARSALGIKDVIENLEAGQHIIAGDHVWGPGRPAYCLEAVNTHYANQFVGYWLIDCIGTAENYLGRNGSGLDHQEQISRYYSSSRGNFLSTISKRIKVLVMDENGQRVSGASVYFTGANGQNLCFGNTVADICNLSDNSSIATDVPYRNYDSNEIAVQHDASEIWLRNNTTTNVAPVAGEEYWYAGERIRLIEQLDTYSILRKWRVERGVTNTVTGWIVYNTSFVHLVRAPQYHVTDVHGSVMNITNLVVFKHKYGIPSDYIGWLFSIPETHASIHWYAPVTITVEKEGYRTWEATYPVEMIEQTGVKPFIVVAQLERPELPIYIQETVDVQLAENRVVLSVAEDQIRAEAVIDNIEAVLIEPNNDIHIDASSQTITGRVE